MKKYFVAVIFTVLTFGLAACGVESENEVEILQRLRDGESVKGLEIKKEVIDEIDEPTPAPDNNGPDKKEIKDRKKEVNKKIEEAVKSIDDKEIKEIEKIDEALKKQLESTDDKEKKKELKELAEEAKKEIREKSDELKKEIKESTKGVEEIKDIEDFAKKAIEDFENDDTIEKISEDFVEDITPNPDDVVRDFKIYWKDGDEIPKRVIRAAYVAVLDRIYAVVNGDDGRAINSDVAIQAAVKTPGTKVEYAFVNLDNDTKSELLVLVEKGGSKEVVAVYSLSSDHSLTVNLECFADSSNYIDVAGRYPDYVNKTRKLRVASFDDYDRENYFLQP